MAVTALKREGLRTAAQAGYQTTLTPNLANAGSPVTSGTSSANASAAGIIFSILPVCN